MRDDSGPAFPSARKSDDTWYELGMTLRDYFAAKAMQAYLSSYPCQSGDNPNVEIGDDTLDAIAGDSYDIADAMLKARENRDA